MGEKKESIDLFTKKKLTTFFFSAKLMETLQAVTPSPSLPSTFKSGGGQSEVTEPSASQLPHATSSQNMMAQSMPASVLSGQLEQVQAVEALSKTCNSLQSQVEQLQSSLAGVMHFMSAFQQPVLEQPQPHLQRGRHSSTEASAADSLSYSYFAPIQMTHSVGPMSLPIQPSGTSATMVPSRPNLPLNKPLSEAMDCQGLAMSR